MIDPAHHNDLLKACPKPPSFRHTLRDVVLGWLAIIALLTMGCSACISPS